MRKILFRGKRVDNGEWVYGSLLKQAGEYISKDGVTPNECWICGMRGEKALIVSETIGQYTGLKDLHGTRIFEKDIVRIYYPFDDPDGCVVSWSKEGARWDFGGCDAYFCTPSKNCEVIGNVYDDVNLLET